MHKHLSLLFFLLLSLFAPAQKATPLDEETKLKATAEGAHGAFISIETTGPGLAEDESIFYRGFFISASGLAVAPLQAFDSGKFYATYESDGTPITILGVVAPDPDSGFAIMQTDRRPASFLILAPKKTVLAVGERVGIYRAKKDGGALTAPIMARRKSTVARSQKYVELLSLAANLGEYGGIHVPVGTPVLDRGGRVAGCLYAPSATSEQRFLLAIPGPTLAARLPPDPRSVAILPLPLPPALLPADPLALDPTYLAGRMAQLAGDYAEAERLLRKALARDAGSAAGWQRLGLVLRARGKGKEATEAFIKAAQRGNNLGSFLLDRADQLSLQGEAEAAAEFLRSACDAVPHDYDLHRAYAVALLSQDKAVEAEKHLRIATKLAPEAMSCWTLLSRCLASQAKWDEEKKASDRIYQLESLYRPR